MLAKSRSVPRSHTRSAAHLYHLTLKACFAVFLGKVCKHGLQPGSQAVSIIGRVLPRGCEGSEGCLVCNISKTLQHRLCVEMVSVQSFLCLRHAMSLVTNCLL